eukprot:819770_1
MILARSEYPMFNVSTRKPITPIKFSIQDPATFHLILLGGYMTDWCDALISNQTNNIPISIIWYGCLCFSASFQNVSKIHIVNTSCYHQVSYLIKGPAKHNTYH